MHCEFYVQTSKSAQLVTRGDKSLASEPTFLVTLALHGTDRSPPDASVGGAAVDTEHIYLDCLILRGCTQDTSLGHIIE